MKIVTAPPGTNPMEMPELIKRRKIAGWKKFALIGAAVLVLSCLCATPAYFITRSNNAKKAAAAANMTATAQVTATATPTTTMTSTATNTATATATSTGTQYPALPTITNTMPPTGTPVVQIVERKITVIVPIAVVITQLVPIRQTVVVIHTVVVTATPTETPTPTPTEAPTEPVEEFPTEVPTPEAPTP